MAITGGIWVAAGVYDGTPPRIDGNFAAYAFKGPNGEVVIAYRGSNGMGDFFGANKDVLLGKWTQQLTMAGEYAKTVRDAAGSGANILVTGHSLGAALAQVMSQAFGFDGATLDPLAAAKIVQTPEFKTMCEQYGLMDSNGQFNGKGMPQSFVNYAAVLSLVSGGTGEQLGRVQNIPGLEFSGLQALVSFLLFLVKPVVSVGSMILQDQVSNKHDAAQAAQVLQMLARAADGGAAILSGKVNFVPKTEEIVDDYGVVTTRPVQGEFLVRSDTNELLGSVKISGSSVSDRLLEIGDANGNLKGTCHAGENPASAVCSMIDTAPAAGSTTNLFTVSTTTALATTTTGSGTPDTGAPPSGLAAAGGSWSVSTDSATLNDKTDAFSALMGDSLTGGIRPGNTSVSGTGARWDLGASAFDSVNQMALAAVTGTPSSLYNFDLAAIIAGSGRDAQYVPADPLVLDLNGDGVKLTSVTEAPVLFSIGHYNDQFKQQTGWASAPDGILVRDNNGNGQIDDISETLSEYYGGGPSGWTITKRHANGFAALKSLDSNDDNQFTSADSAWNGADWHGVKVWIDANHDGKTDTGELRTLDSLGITSISLTPTLQSGLMNNGNDILATGSFVQNGVTREVQAASFNANRHGQFLDPRHPGRVYSETDNGLIASYIAQTATGEAMSADEKIANLTGNLGNDTLTGDANANWLAGSLGADTFNAGAGDDVLLIDAEDRQANIHGGTGNDIAQVIGDQGVTLNLAQAEIESAIGGRGDDVFIGGGRSSVFIRGGDGDDILIGGAANDALSGEDGSDLIDGGAGNDIVRGGRGSDQLMGGAGDDVIQGGQDDDKLSGGAGSDVLHGEQGDDTLDGGDGQDVVEVSGSYGVYRLTQVGDGWWVRDTVAGRDGNDFVKNVEAITFKDVTNVPLGSQPGPMPVRDILTVDSGGAAFSHTATARTIAKSQLLGNDIDWQNDVLHITAIADVQGGAATINANGDVVFTPDATFTGLMGFQYQVADAAGNFVNLMGAGESARMKGTVWLKTPDLPSDPLLTEEWYLSAANILPVWQDYTGKGVRIGQFEPGSAFATTKEIFDLHHPDLQPNLNAAWLANPHPGERAGEGSDGNYSNHATLVAGVMVAARNGEGGVGVAYDATLGGHSLGMHGEDVSALRNCLNYDVANNSWASTQPFTLGFGQSLQSGYYVNAVRYGRGGLGTVIVAGGGNSRAKGGNANYDNSGNNRYAIQVGAINAANDLGALQIAPSPFSNPGASLLVSAPG